MTRLVLGMTICCAIAITGNTAMAGSTFPYEYHREILPNGLTVILIPMESPGLVAYYSIVRTGSRDEVEPGKSGFAHFFEHMMFRGTKKYPGPVYDSVITSIGADANAYTTDDLTAYHLNFAKEDLEKVIEMESDRFQNLHYGEADFKTEAGAVYGEYRKNITSPFAVLHEKMRDLAYDVHTYKHTTIGFEQDIKAMPEAFDYSWSFFSRFYRPDNVVLLITGDIETAQTLRVIRQYYGDWQKGYVPPKVLPEPAQQTERSAEISYPGKTLPILNIAYKGDSLDPGNMNYVAALLFGELAFGESSDLYKKLVIQEQKVQFLASSFPMNRDLPLFQIFSMVKTEEDITYVRNQVYETIETFRSTLVDPVKLDNLKRRSKYGFLMNLDTPNKVAGGLARFVAITGGMEVVDELYNAFDRVSPQDIKNAVSRYFMPDRRTIVTLKGVRE